MSVAWSKAHPGAVRDGDVPWPGKLTFVGPGKMGAPMVRLLLRAGAPLTVLARRPEARDEFAALGARTASTVAEAVDGAAVVIACLFDEPQLDEVVLGEGGLVEASAPGTVLVSHTTTGLVTLGRIEEAARERGQLLVDAPVSGAAEEIEGGRLTILAGGEPEVVDRVLPVLSTYSTVVCTGGVGTASRAKLVNNLLFTANVQLVAAAAELGRALGIADAGLLEALSRCSGGSEAVRHMRAHGRTPEEFGARASRYLGKDVDAALAAAAELGADSALLEHVARNGPIDLIGGAVRG